MKRSYRIWALGVAMVLVLGAAGFAQDDKAKPKTTADPKVKTAALEWMLKPLREDQLAVDADGWCDLLEKKIAEISAVEIAAKNSDKEPDDKALEALRGERDGLVERASLVLAAWKAKGGDEKEVAKLETYVSEVDGSVTEEIEAPADLEEAGELITKATDWLTSTEGGVKWGLNIVRFLVILFLFMLIANVLGAVVRRGVSRLKTSDLLKDFFANTVKKVAFFVGLVIALSQLGIDIGPLIAGIGALGLVVGFALSDTLGNFASGIMILMYRPYDIGDLVGVSGANGTVTAMTLVSTTICTLDNQLVIVPNSKIWGDVITNVTGNKTRRVDMMFGIGYSDDIAKAQKILEEVVAAHEKVLKDPEPTIKVHELGDSSVNFICRPWAKTSDYWDVYWDLTRTVKERFDKDGVSIPFPQRDVHLYQEANA